MFLDHGDAPTHGGERPHVTVTMRYDDLTQRIADAVLSYGGPVSAAEARRIACDARDHPRRPRHRIRSPRCRPGEPVVHPRRSAKPSHYGTKDAHSPGVTGRSPGATPTTSPTGCTTAKVPTPMAVLLCRHHHTVIHKGALDHRVRHRRCPRIHPPTMDRSEIRNPDATPPTTSPPCSGRERSTDAPLRICGLCWGSSATRQQGSPPARCAGAHGSRHQREWTSCARLTRRAAGRTGLWHRPEPIQIVGMT